MQRQQNSPNKYVLSLSELDSSMLPLAGGKGANLGELCRIKGITVPPGFCVTTEAFKKVTGDNGELNALLDELDKLTATGRETIKKASAKLRAVIEGMPIPNDITEEVVASLAMLGEDESFAVRSSATAEDLSGASFAGQQDTYLNVIGRDAILQHIRRCWASLFTERAVTYRMQNGFGHRKVYLSVVVQKMVFPQAAGILFTADPVSGNRKVASIDAGFGLGEAMVAGLVNADNYKVLNSVITAKNIPAKKLAIYALKSGGTTEQAIEPGRQLEQVLTDEQIIQLAQTGRKIETHFGRPQDIEWCLADGGFYIVQSRPVTTLFPAPVAGDGQTHVYASVGHLQMMMDAMKPLGISLWQITSTRPMSTAGGRLFVDITAMLATPEGRQGLMDTLGKSDPLTKDALTTIIARQGFIPPQASTAQAPGADKGNQVLPPQAQISNDPVVANDLVQASEASVAAVRQTMETKQGAEALEYILESSKELKRLLFVPQNMGAIMAAVNSSAWLNEKMAEWLGEKNVADTLSLSAPNNVTSEMGLALMDVADVIRPYAEVVDYLKYTKSDNFLNEITVLKGGKESRAAIEAWLEKYGMRCTGEIDVTRERWSEKPVMLIPLILNNINNFDAGAGKMKFEQGLVAALNKEQDLLARLKELPGGEEKAAATKEMIRWLRNFIGYREYPKYGIISHYFVYRQALLKEAERLVQGGVIKEKEDIYYLTFQELQDVVRTDTADYGLINLRKEEYRHYEKLTPPRMITSDGEIITGAYKRENLPAGAIVGLAVSTGVIEGRARVILNMEDAAMQDGDILVTAFTDPGWTPLFVAIKGLVTEVGGLMTHGAVIAREYGLPAVVGAENATKLIKDGQRIRVNGTDGYIEILE